MCGVAKDEAVSALARLIAAGRVEQALVQDRTVFSSPTFYIGQGTNEGWEAAMYDHYHAVVRTLCNRLEPLEVREPFKESIGGSTYTYDVGPGHPLEAEVLSLLARLRAECRDLRARVSAYNTQHGRSPEGENVVVYVGQSVLPRESLIPAAASLDGTNIPPQTTFDSFPSTKE